MKRFLVVSKIGAGLRMRVWGSVRAMRKRHRVLIGMIGFVLMAAPQFISTWWGLFSEAPLVPTLVELAENWEGPRFPWTWETGVRWTITAFGALLLLSVAMKERRAMLHESPQGASRGETWPVHWESQGRRFSVRTDPTIIKAQEGGSEAEGTKIIAVVNEDLPQPIHLRVVCKKRVDRVGFWIARNGRGVHKNWRHDSDGYSIRVRISEPQLKVGDQLHFMLTGPERLDDVPRLYVADEV